jgi:hypothetical protein
MAHKEIRWREQDLHHLDDAALERHIRAELPTDLAHRAGEVANKIKDALATPRGGGDNAVKVMIPLPPATGPVIAVRDSVPVV